jgi:hypothetical protein
MGMTTHGYKEVPATRELETEERLLEEAIALVASGRSRRVVVAGLPDSVLLLDVAGRSADRAGVRVRPLPEIRHGILDVAIEAVPPSETIARALDHAQRGPNGP